jgi:hypothetical protein
MIAVEDDNTSMLNQSGRLLQPSKMLGIDLDRMWIGFRFSADRASFLRCVYRAMATSN